MKVLQVLVLFLLAATFMRDAVVAEEKSSDSLTRQLQGRWEIVAGVNQGKELSAAELAGTYVSVTVNEIVTFDSDNNQRYKAVFAIDESTTPIEINMTSIPDATTSKEPATKKEASHINAAGIVKRISPDKWMLCYALPGEDRPSKFESPAKSKIILFTLSKQTDTPIAEAKGD